MLLFDDLFDVSPFSLAPSLFRRGAITGVPYDSLLLNVSSTSTHYIVRTELPGIPQNQISVEITEDGVLSIQAERHSKDEKGKVDEEKENEIVKESWVTQGKLYRSLKFNKGSIDVDGIKAELNNGELIVKVPKKSQPEKGKGRMIKIIKGKL